MLWFGARVGFRQIREDFVILIVLHDGVVAIVIAVFVAVGDMEKSQSLGRAFLHGIDIRVFDRLRAFRRVSKQASP